jgi:hypothetical protein
MVAGRYKRPVFGRDFAMKKVLAVAGWLVFLAFSVFAVQQPKESLTPSLGIADANLTVEQQLLLTAHSISSNKLYDYVAELTSEKYAGRLTGTAEYNACAEWVVRKFEQFGLQGGGDNGSFYQTFANPYTLVFPGCELSLRTQKNGRKQYKYPDDFIPGSTSGSGEVTAKVVYVGYGITAPELNYDDYAGVDVKGKIILCEREVPVAEDGDPNVFLKWRPYSFHQYKIENAVAHGAVGMLYNYGPIGNPNNAYVKGFIYSHVGSAVIENIFADTGKSYAETIKGIKADLKPSSFATGKIVTIKNVTEYHPEGIAKNVIGIFEGCDPTLKEEVLVISAHLDHLGKCYTLMPGANDNASGVAVLLGAAEALIKSPVKPRRSVMFICFGAEEQGVAGSKYFVEHPPIPLNRIIGVINMDSVGAGDKLAVRGAKNYPAFWQIVETVNQKYLHEITEPGLFINLARPRNDASWFMWKQIPSLTFKSYGGPEVYHVPADNLSIINPEIIEAMSQLVFLSITDLTTEADINLKAGASNLLFVPSELK